MILSIKKIIQLYGIEGDILLYRDENHRKQGLCDYLKSNLPIENKTVITYSDGALALFLARALPENKVITHYGRISPDYGELMVAQPNLVLNNNFYNLDEWKSYCKEHYVGDDYIIINQYEDSLLTEYYKGYFPKVVEAFKDYKVDAFCDCGHSCQTMAGFISKNKENKLVDWQFILGVNLLPRRKLWKLTDLQNDFVQYITRDYNTLIVGKEIEATYPEFGNVFEATRSITAAMSYLREHPGQTVAIYIGDAFEKEGTKFGQDK